MRIYSLQTTSDSSIKYELLRTLKPHTTPVVVLAVDQRSSLLATGAADGVVKVWDIVGGYVTHTFRGPNILISALHFFELVARNEEEAISAKSRSRHKDAAESTGGFRLASGSQDGKVRIWNLNKSTSVAVLESHDSDVRALDYSVEDNTLLTGSRDKTIVWWDARTWKITKTIAVLEEVEAAGFLNSGKLAYTGGANGNIRIWQSENGREVTRKQSPRGETDAILSAVYYRGLSYLFTVQSDHTMVLHSLSSLDTNDLDSLSVCFIFGNTWIHKLTLSPPDSFIRANTKNLRNS
jgi:U3 small nucleolar RNA-associated protein 13